MRRAKPLPSDCYVDPLKALERKRAEAEGKTPTKREIAEMGNRPIQEIPADRRASKPKRSEA